MISFGRRHVRPIGLDVGTDSVKMLQLWARPGGAEVIAAARRALRAEDRTPDSLVACLEAMSAQAPFVGRRLIATLPPEIIHTRTLRLPALPLDPLQAMRAEAADLFPFDLSDAMVRFLPVGLIQQNNNSREFIAFAARNGDVAAFLGSLRRAGFRVDSLQIGALAAYRSTHVAQDPQEVRAVLDLGARRATLVMGRGENINFIKTIEIGGRHFDQAVGHKLGLDDSEVRQLRRRLSRPAATLPLRGNPVASAIFDATRGLAQNLAHQVAMCFRYHAITFRGQRPSRLALLGGQAADPNLRHILSSALSLPAEPVNPLEGMNIRAMRPSDCEPPAGEWGICAGLGLPHIHSILQQPCEIESRRIAA